MSSRHRNRSERKYNLQTGQWAEKHDVFHDLVPYGYRKHSPIKLLRTLRTHFHSLPKYAQLWHMTELPDELKKGITSNRSRLLYFAGSWPLNRHRTGNAHSYANPLYPHDTYPAVKERQKRNEIIDQTRDIPYWTGKQLGIVFGVSKDRASRLARQRYGTFQGKHHDLTRFYRTMKLLHEWTDNTWPELAECVPLAPITLRTSVYHHAQEFEVPSNPLDSGFD